MRSAIPARLHLHFSPHAEAVMTVHLFDLLSQPDQLAMQITFFSSSCRQQPSGCYYTADLLQEGGDCHVVTLSILFTILFFSILRHLPVLPYFIFFNLSPYLGLSN